MTADSPTQQQILANLLQAFAEIPADEVGQPTIAIITARRKGAVLARGAFLGVDRCQVIGEALQLIVTAIGGGIKKADALQLEIGVRLRPMEISKLANVHTGKHGLLLVRQQQLLDAFGGLDMIATNRCMSRAVPWLLEQHGLTAESLAQSETKLLTFDSNQVQLWLLPVLKQVPLFRGNRIITPEEITRDRVAQLAKGMSDWMGNQVDATGRIVYKYWPSAGTQSSADNSIRQVMATLCLGRIANRSGHTKDRAIADRNLDHLLREYYREEGTTLGLIVEQVAVGSPKAKLGAIALTALAILEHPVASRYQEPFQRLVNTVDVLSHADGSFQTFYWPSDRNDNHNFYPGETLLFWAIALQRGVAVTTAQRYLASFRHYRDFFRANPNPAFVPWHTQAHVHLFAVLPEQEIADFVFEMNDWLLEMVQWKRAPYPDLMGRFYNPERRDFGPPHASSTAVYLEGLIDAWQLAKRFGMLDRADQYRVAILRGCRSLCQLQFSTAEDMFYVTRKNPVAGGIRTEVYDNSIRVDNVQHGLMALHRILDRFTAEDFLLNTG